MADIITYDHCVCCGSNAIHKVLDCADYTVSKEMFEVWHCSSCTFRFTQSVPNEANIGPYYKSDAYVSHSDTKAGLINRLYHFVRKITLRGKLNLVNGVTGVKNGELLDIGAGTGAFAHTMQQAGWKVTALEPDETAKATALANYNLHLLPLDRLHGLTEARFNAITMWHVLEHVHDLHGYLETFKRILHPQGKLLVAVPNYTSYDAQTYNRYWAAYDVPRHLWHFSPESMKQLLDEKGFIIEAVKPMWFDSFYVSMLSEKYKNGRNNYIGALITGLISNFKSLFNAKKCSSVIYIIRKK